MFATLDEEECRRLLATSAVGRVGLSVDTLPVVLPVNYVLDGDRVVFRTGRGSKLSAAVRNAVVCFEVDDIDGAGRSGWSVVVTGVARELDGPEAEAAAALPLEPWSGTDGDHLVAVDVTIVSGRRID